MQHRNTQRVAGQGGDQIAGFLTQEKRARQFSEKPLLRFVTFAPEAGGLQHETARSYAHSARGYGSGAAAGGEGGARSHCRTGIHGGGGGAAGTGCRLCEGLGCGTAGRAGYGIAGVLHRARRHAGARRF